MSNIRTNGEKKKPPISITELNKKNSEEHQQGALSYVDPGKNNRGGPVSTGKSKINITQLVLAIGLSVLIFVLISNFWLSSKKDATTLLNNQQILETKQNSIQTTVTQDSGRIDNVIANYATVASLAGYAKTSDLSGYQTQLTGLSNSISDVLSRLTSYDTRITSLETQVNALNQTAGGGSGLTYYLTESGGVYRLRVTSSKSGLFSARMTLIASSNYIVGDLTTSINDATKEFYDSIDGTKNVAPIRSYIPTFQWTDEGWKLLSISFYTKSFNLEANEELSTLIYIKGLPTYYSTYTGYVEVLPGFVLGEEEEESLGI